MKKRFMAFLLVVVMIEIRINKENYYMIEANPRFWGPSQLFVDFHMTRLFCAWLFLGSVVELDRQGNGLYDRVVDENVERGASRIRCVEAESVAGFHLGGFERLLLEVHDGSVVDSRLTLVAGRSRTGGARKLQSRSRRVDGSGCLCFDVNIEIKETKFDEVN